MDDPELYKPETSLRNEESSLTTEDAANNNNSDGVPVQIKQNTQRSTWPRYSVLLAEHPYAVFFFMLVLIIICGLASFLPQFNAPDFPDFSTPVMGFEPRGTKINTRYRTSRLLGKAANLGLVATSPFSELNNTCNISMDLPNVNGIFLTPKTKMNRTRRHAKKNFHLVMCDSPNVFMKSKISYKMIFASTISGHDIFNARSLKAVCRMEEKLMRKAPGFNLNCFKKNTRYDTGRVVECCPSWSVGNYIAALSKKSSCKDISSADVLNVFSLLRQCAPFYNNASLKENCWDFKYKTVYPVCRSLPVRCVRYNAVHNIMYYLTDKHFLGPNGEKLTYTSVLIPAIRDKTYRNHIYETYLKKGDVSDGSVKLVGTDFYSLKFDMFNTMLLADIIYPSIALMIILLIMWFYTESVLITFLLMFSVISALIIAYFLYMIVFGLKFFPFLNITTLIFLVGIGADDAFVFSDVWRQSKLNNPGATLARITAETLKHASLSMFVTSFTTAAAFIANFSSQITTIKCFGIYAGIAILCKFSMMVTWFPAVSVINEKLCVPWSCNKRSTWQTIRNFYERYVGYFVRYFFEQFLPHIVIKFRFFWIALFSVLTLGGLEILLFKPGFRLPTSSDFQMFEASHPLEVYELNLKENFRFETSPSHGSATFLIALFWGLKAIDNGNQLNPYDYGTLEWDKSFNVTKSESQKWLLGFCRRLRREGFYAKKEGEASYCFLEKYYNQSCHDPLTPNISYHPCCRDMPFPFNKTVLDLCAVKASVRAHLLKFKRHDSTIGSFIYDKQGNIKGVHMSIYSNVPLSRAYQPALQFYERIESWLKRETSTAPDGMKRAWWTSNLEFYDLQKSLSSGTLVSMAIAIAMAFAVMLLTTLNVLVSVYAILTIIGIISVTTGSLVLSGWKLNILESITMSVAVGVSIDFAMHFGVAYCLAPNKECRKARVRFSLSRMGSAITMAAVTTFIAGAMMMPSRVLSYLQMGHFLMLVMTLGWAFSTFFFQALCCTIGPQGDWGQFSWRSILSCCCKRVSDKAQPKEKMELLQYNCETCENELESNDLVVKSVGFKSVKTTAV